MEFLLLGSQGIFTLIVIAGLAKIYREIKKGNKDQQEIKTRLTWIKKRQQEK